MLKIGLFDSGIGGFSLLGQLDRVMNDVDFYYIADHQFAPYGNKNSQQIVDRAHLLTQKLLQEGVDLILVACNTATAMAITSLRHDYPDVLFVGIEPYLNVINRYPELIDRYKGVVLSTLATNHSHRFLDLRQRLDPSEHLDYVGLPNLATIIEEYYLNGDIELLEKRVTKQLDEYVCKKYDFAVLGCTHYPLILSLIEKILNVHCYSPSKFVVNRVVDLLEYTISDIGQKGHTYYYSTSQPKEVWNCLPTANLLSLFHTEKDSSA